MLGLLATKAQEDIVISPPPPVSPGPVSHCFFRDLFILLTALTISHYYKILFCTCSYLISYSTENLHNKTSVK